MTRYISLAEYLVITELAAGFAAEELMATWRIDPAGDIDEAALADWLRERLVFGEQS